MTESRRPSEIRLQDPLSEVTRTERRTLLGVSAVGIVIAQSGLVPSKISALGIEFDRTDQSALLKMLAVIVVYFLVAFLIYATSDFVAWRTSYHYAVREWRKRGALMNDQEREVEEHAMRDYLRRWALWSRVGRPTSVLRALFEFVVPIFVGLYAVHALSTTPPPRTASIPQAGLAAMPQTGPSTVSTPPYRPAAQPAAAADERQELSGHQ